MKQDKLTPIARKERRTALVHRDFLERLKFEAARHGSTVVKYTEELAKKPDPLESITQNWKEKYQLKVKKIEKKNYLDFP